MRALSVWQPWPYAMIAWGKCVENRTWAPPRGVVGGPPLAIHAAQAVDAPALEALARRGYRAPPSLARGAVVCTVRVVAAVARAPAIGPGAGRRLGNAIGAPWYTIIDAAVSPERVHALIGADDGLWYAGDVGWVFDDVAACAVPVGCRGQQGIWTLPADVEYQVNQEVEHGRGTR
jgi:hypothetical protein